jgi:heat shock protein HslJ
MTAGIRRLLTCAFVSVLVVASTVVAGCGTKTASLSGTDWRLVTLAGQPALAEFPVTMTLDQKGGVFGSSGVNRYMGTYKADGKTLTFGSPFAGTMMAGPEPAMNQEKAFLAALAATKAYSVSGDTLKLSDGSKVELATFAKSVPAALQGTPWSASGYNNGKGGVVGLAADSSITAVFGNDGALGGNASVNTYRTTFTTGDGSMTISPVILSTKMAGPPALMEQEAQYLAALARVTTFALSVDTRELRSADGALQVLFRNK